MLQNQASDIEPGFAQGWRRKVDSAARWILALAETRVRFNQFVLLSDLVGRKATFETGRFNIAERRL
jgi:hypothetical protein